MIKNRNLEGVWGWFVACFRAKAPVGRFLDASGAALGRFLAHLGRPLGGSWAVLGRPGRFLDASRRRLGGNWTPKWSQLKIKVSESMDLMPN